MSNLPRKVLLLLSPLQKVKASVLVFLMFFSSIMEVFNLGLLIVIMNFFLESEDKNENSLIYGFLNNFVSDKENSFLLILLVFFTIFLLKIILLIYFSWLEAGFFARFRERLSNNIFKNFLSRNVYKILKVYFFVKKFTPDTIEFAKPLFDLLLIKLSFMYGLYFVIKVPVLLIDPGLVRRHFYLRPIARPDFNFIVWSAQ